MGGYLCKRCLNQDFQCYNSLIRHVSRIHKIKPAEFYVEFYLKGEWPKCKCGCGENTKWSPQLKGFRYFKAGHQSRIHNNWGHNKKAIDRSSETRRQQYASGERRVWNDGLTIEDQRVRVNSEKSKNAINSNSNELKRRAELMSKNRKNGIIPTLYGSQSSQWKGGISEINNITRTDKRLYDEWKYPILVRDEFKCKECGNNDKLHIHHDKEKMCEIVKKHVVDGGIEMDFDLKKSIADKIVNYHIQNKVSGITLCGECHKKYHPSLNFC